MSLNSCLDCPSMLTAVEAMDFYGDASIKVPMCARFGHLLAIPASAGTVDPDANVCVKIGQKCSMHGKDRPTGPTSSFKASLFMPDASKLENQPNDTRVNNCFDCGNCKRVTDYGVYACSVKGNVIFNSRRITESEDCPWRKWGGGAPVEEVTTLNLHPTFDSTTTRKTVKEPVSMFKVIDPRTMDSDMKVRDEDKGIIRAWIEVPKGNKGKTTHYPIFETEYFSEEERQLIPTATAEDGDPSLYVDHANLMSRFMTIGYAADRVTCLIGEPGSGKTTGCRHLAWKMNMPFWATNYTEDTDPDEVLGMMGFKEGVGTVLQPGIVPKRWQMPGILLGDELNLADEAIKQAYRSAFDSSKSFVVYGQKFHRHDYCFPFVAINPAYDYKNIGAKEMASADVRRMSYFYMPSPDSEMKKRIIKASIKKMHDVDLPNSLVDVIVKVSDALEKMTQNGELQHHWTLSQDIKVAQFSMDWTLEESYKMAYLFYVEPKSANVILAAIKTYFPSGM